MVRSTNPQHQHSDNCCSSFMKPPVMKIMLVSLGFILGLAGSFIYCRFNNNTIGHKWSQMQAEFVEHTNSISELNRKFEEKMRKIVQAEKFEKQQAHEEAKKEVEKSKSVVVDDSSNK